MADPRDSDYHGNIEHPERDASCKYWIVIDEENAPPRAMFRQQYEAENFRELNGGRVETFTMKIRY